MASVAALPSSSATFIASLECPLDELAASMRAEQPVRGIAMILVISGSNRGTVSVWGYGRQF